MRLEDAVRKYVDPEMHLHFASTPSRSNAAIREVARVFRRRDPRFVISTTGFHSHAHLLPALRLGRKYISCFFGDNYPVPRPNGLYTRIRAEGAELQFWSLLSYVTSLRAAALGDDWAVTRSLRGTTMAEDLAKSGAYREAGELALVRAMRPDITFLHAPLADEDGNVVFSAPFSEGFHAPLSSRTGTIITVERVLARGSLREFHDAMPIPRARILAVAEEPNGAHPQSLFVLPRFGFAGYKDDFSHYERWREMTDRHESLGEYERVLAADDGRAAYRAFVADTPRGAERRAESELHQKSSATQLVLAARRIVERVKERGYKTILAGLGQSFLAARLAKVWLNEAKIDVAVIVETGMIDLDCGPGAADYLLAYDNIARSKRLTSVEHVLGALACGAQKDCLAVVGAAEIDESGDFNTTRLGEKILVGSGGANDLASSAGEVIVLSRCAPGRMVKKVSYVTSPGGRVFSVITELCTFERAQIGGAWRATRIYPAHGGRPLEHVLAEIRRSCPWAFEVAADEEFTAAMSTSEQMALHRLA